MKDLMQNRASQATAMPAQSAGPERVQLRRTKGWRLPPNTVKVDRSTPFGNPWTIADCNGSAAEAVRMFRARLDGPFAGDFHPNSYMGRLASAIPELRGKNLACWCPLGGPCHADVLLEIANDPLTDGAGAAATDTPAPRRDPAATGSEP